MATFRNKFNAFKAIVNKILTPIAFVALLLALVGWVPAGTGGTVFFYSSLMLVVWLATNCIYIMDAGLLGVPLIFGEVAHKTFKPGWNICWPFVVDIIYLPTRLLTIPVQVKDIEATDTFHLGVQTTCQYQLNWDEAWKLVNHYQSQQDGYSLGELSKILSLYLSRIIVATYRGTNLDTFFANKILQGTMEDTVQDQFLDKVEEELDKTCGFDVIQNIQVINYEYIPDPKWLALSQAKEGAKQRKQEKITDAEAEKAATEIRADALSYALRQQANADAYAVLQKGLQNAEVQKAIGQVLKDHPGLTMFEAVKHIPHYLSIGGSTNLDIAQFTAVLKDIFGTKPDTATTEDIGDADVEVVEEPTGGEEEEATPAPGA